MNHPRWTALLAVALLALACQPPQEPAETASPEATPTARWQCRNDVEVGCDAGTCEASESFTPMDVTVDDAGMMSVCAYSGCWEGTGTVTQQDPFLVLTGRDLPFSTAPDSVARGADIVIALDKTDQVAVLKAGSFAHPLHCQPQAEGS